MDSFDLEVLSQVHDWLLSGKSVVLVTVAQTSGSAPRQPGALLALRADGLRAGSVSSGCVEEDLIERLREDRDLRFPAVLEYGKDPKEAGRLRLPCGGMLRLVVERITATSWIEEVLARTARHRLVARDLNLNDGSIRLREAHPTEVTRLEGHRFVTVFGPPWKLLLIGASEVARVLAGMAKALGFRVLLCDPRPAEAPARSWPGVEYLPGMPDEAVAHLPPDCRTAVVALAHDVMLDDMALLSALKSDAFYIGALGSRAAAVKRKERLAPYFFPEELDRLRSPVGLDLGTHAPGEIAVAILAEIIAVKNRRGNEASGQEGISSRPERTRAMAPSFCEESV